MDAPISAKAALLQALGRIGPAAHGADLKRFLSDQGLDLSEGSVYPALAALEDEGSIRRVRTLARAGNHYGLTARGQRLVQEHRVLIGWVFELGPESVQKPKKR